MHKAIATIKGEAPYSASAFIKTVRAAKESPADWEERTWRERLNVNDAGTAIIPAMAFKNMLDTAAKRFPIKKKGMTTYTKNFEGGVLVIDPLVLPGVTRENVRGEWLHVPSDGQVGGTKRVLKCFPLIQQWGGEVVFDILDETITELVFTETLRQALAFIGLGRFRPEKRGFYGRATLTKLVWK